jgi:ABC-2 type transport system permease protein
MTSLHAEWTKQRTAPGTVWLFVSTIALTAAVSAFAAATMKCPPEGCTLDPIKISLTGIVLGQTIVAILAVLAIGGEYSTGMIRTSLIATPRRTTLLAAKAALVAAVALAAGVIAVLASLLAGRLILRGRGIAVMSLADEPVMRATVGSILYLGLIAVLGLGVAAAVRDSATSIGIVLALLYLFPIVSQAVSDAQWRRHLGQIAPMSAGLAVQATTDLDKLPIQPWAGLGVLAAWAGGALLLGWVVLRFRDA